MINRLINRDKIRSHNNIDSPEQEYVWEHHYALQVYSVEGLSQQITRCVQRSGEYNNVNIVHYYNNTMGSIYTAMKGKTDTLQRSNVIYCIGCQQCDAKYVGLTTNKLQTRIYGHKSDVNFLDKVVSIENTSDRLNKLGHLRERTAMIAHCIDTGHRFDLQNATILDQSRRPTRLPILEICHIMTTQNVNKRTDVDGLNTYYRGIMYTLKRKSHNNTRNRNNQDQNDQEITPIQIEEI